MIKSLAKRIAVVSRRTLRDFNRRTEGIAAVEFALIVPIMVTLLIGAVELSQAITVDRRVTQVSTTTGDLVARADKDIPKTEVDDIMKVGSWLLRPYKVDYLKVTISAVQSSSSSATAGKVSWKCVFNGTDTAANCTCPNLTDREDFAIPTGLTTTSDAVIISEVVYNYQPLVFDVFLKANKTKNGLGYDLTEKVYLKPRGACPALGIKRPDGSDCKC